MCKCMYVCMYSCVSSQTQHGGIFQTCVRSTAVAAVTMTTLQRWRAMTREKDWNEQVMASGTLQQIKVHYSKHFFFLLLSKGHSSHFFFVCLEEKKSLSLNRVWIQVLRFLVLCADVDKAFPPPSSLWFMIWKEAFLFEFFFVLLFLHLLVWLLGWFQIVLSLCRPLLSLRGSATRRPLGVNLCFDIHRVLIHGFSSLVVKMSDERVGRSSPPSCPYLTLFLEALQVQSPARVRKGLRCAAEVH